MSMPKVIKLPTRKLAPAVLDVLRSLLPGQRIEIKQAVRVGRRQWTAVVAGVFREINYLATGVTTDRVPDDDIVVPMVHFTKDNGELSSIALDERTTLRILPRLDS